MPPRSPFTASKQVRMLPDTLRYLDWLAREHNTTSSDLIRRAVDYWLRRRAEVPRTREEEERLFRQDVTGLTENPEAQELLL